MHDLIPPPTSADVACFTDEECGAAIAAYRAWTVAELTRYHLSIESIADIIGRVEALHDLPYEVRIAHTAAELEFLTDTYHWLEGEPHAFPAVPALLDLLGDILFLRAEAEAFAIGMGTLEPAPPSSVRFTRACHAYGAAQGLLLARIRGVSPAILSADPRRYTQWVGFAIAHGQAVGKLLRAMVRTISYHVIERAAHSPPPIVRATAVTHAVYALQQREPELTIAPETRTCAEECLAHASATARVRFGDYTTAGAVLLNTATLAALLGDWTRARAYARVILALHAEGHPIAGVPEARAALACADQHAHA